MSSSPWQRTRITGAHWARELDTPWMADHKGKSVGPDKLEMVASFCYLGDMLEAAGDCELSTTICVKTAWKSFKEMLPVLSFKTRGHIYSSCMWSPMLPGQWQSQTSNICRGMTGQWSDSSAMSSHKTLSTSGPIGYLHSLALRMWTSSWRTEGSLIWTHGMLQRCSQVNLWHTGWRKAWAWEAQDDMEAADREGSQRGSFWLQTLMIDTPGDVVWDLPCVQQASYLEGGPVTWMNLVKMMMRMSSVTLQNPFV